MQKAPAPVHVTLFDAYPLRFFRGRPQAPRPSQATWIKEPKMGSISTEVPDNVTNQGVSEYGLQLDRRSCVSSEAMCLVSTPPLIGNESKFEWQVYESCRLVPLLKARCRMAMCSGGTYQNRLGALKFGYDSCMLRATVEALVELLTGAPLEQKHVTHNYLETGRLGHS